jgi:Rrf2 family protein
MRLELSRRTDLAIRALRRLAALGARVKRPDLAADTGTTPDFLARVMAPLVRAGWVASEPGRGGGYALTADLSAVSVLQVIAVSEGLPEAGRCVLRGGPCPTATPCALHDPWGEARDALLERLDATAVARAEG